jgi:L-cysteine:1D-myo-inositol 2-amino-2-deoxy-alpha-D-glucopyranoside ligase
MHHDVPPVLLFDTLSGERRPLPEDEPVSLYVCGVTPYDTTHLGHAFTFVQFDTLVRALRWLGRRVVYVQNVTDIDDSILGRARKLGVDWRELGDEQTALYLADMRALNVAAPDHYVRATDAISTIHELVEALLRADAAYEATGGGVYFRVRSTPTYGELSKLDRAAMLAIASQQDDADVDDPRKEDPLDFALWKAWSGRDDEPCWPSPWGPGRPGWHIECSAMCRQFLGPQLTLHGGGAVLIFPHHESEIAQSERAAGVRPFVRTWVHSAMVRMDGAKMSKSLGNMVFVRDLLDRYSSDVLRLYLLGHHYRQVWEWSPADLDAAAALAERLTLAAGEPDYAGGAREAFASALRNDLDTPSAIEALERASGAPLRELAGVLGLELRPES